MERTRCVPASQISAGSRFASSLAEALQIIIVRHPQVIVTHFQHLPQQRPIIEGYPVIIERLDHPDSQGLNLCGGADHSRQHNKEDYGGSHKGYFPASITTVPPAKSAGTGRNTTYQE